MKCYNCGDYTPSVTLRGMGRCAQKSGKLICGDSHACDKWSHPMLCAWCQKVIGDSKCLSSHGICKECAKKELDEFKRKLKEEK